MQGYMYQFQTWILLANPEYWYIQLCSFVAIVAKLCAKASVQMEGHNNKITALQPPVTVYLKVLL